MSNSHTYSSPSQEWSYVYSKQNCEHTKKHLMVHDEGNVVLTYSSGSDMDLSQVNDLINAGIRFARIQDWIEVCGRRTPSPILVALPRGLKNYVLLFCRKTSKY